MQRAPQMMRGHPEVNGVWSGRVSIFLIFIFGIRSEVRPKILAGIFAAQRH